MSGMTRLLQISDTHFGTEQPAVVEALTQMAREQRPDVLVLSGDITQRASPGQFRAARAFCERLQIPRMLALPGNHDIPLFNLYRRFVSPYAAYLRSFGPELESVLQTESLLVVGVKTTRRYRHKNGEVSAAQIDQVATQLKRARPEQLRIVVVHQPVFVPNEADAHDRLLNVEPALQRWCAAGADVVMGGHIHLPYVADLSIAVPGLLRRMWCVQAGTALSSRVRLEAPNSVNLLHYRGQIGESRCCVERWDFQSTTRDFVPVKITELNFETLPV